MGRSIVVAVAAALFLFAALEVHAVDRELTQDFLVPAGEVANAEFFTFQGLRNPTVNDSPFATVTTATLDTGFDALDSLGVSTALVQFPPGSVNQPHTHPRGTEILYVIEGTLDVGLVTQQGTNNTLITQTLEKGDLFVFPRGLVHFQINWSKELVSTFASFGSSNPGRITLPNALFASVPPINDEVLARSFQVSQDIIQTLKAALT